MSENEALKRNREHETDLDFDLPDAKMTRYDLLDILDESDADLTVNDLESVMRSLEEEILFSSSSPVPTASKTEIGYLLEASDDDLGLPPSNAADGKVEEVTESLNFGSEDVGLGDIWGLEEADAAGVVAEFVGDAGNRDGEYLALDDLFDYSDVGFGSTEISLGSESMPAQ